MKFVGQSALRSDLAGAWYTDDPKALKKELDGLRAAADGAPDDAVSALILPHAGYAYSGAVAACGARAVEGRSFRRIVILGPSHRVPLHNTVAVPDGASCYSTILGDMPVDTALIKRLSRYPLFQSVAGTLPGEHSVEMQLPLLQAALGNVPIAPMVVGRLDDLAVQEIADCLRAEIDESTLVVVSTDFTHFGPRFDFAPFANDVEARLKALDLGAYAFIEGKDVNGFRRYLDRTGATVCGRDPLAVLIAMLPPEAEVIRLAYDTSGRICGDWENSVSYLSAAVRCRWTGRPLERPAEKAPRARRSDTPFDIPPDDRTALLDLARDVIGGFLSTGKRTAPKALGIRVTPAMNEIAGAFVTLHIDGRLRGCIGEIVPTRPLVEAVADHALNAAFRDPRFEPLTARELARCVIEISALSEPRDIGSWKEIVVGRHGVILHKEGHSAVFLPQVAPEQGWTAETMLDHLAEKAGLRRDDWREDARLEVFEALVFGEHDPHRRPAGRGGRPKSEG